MKRKMQILGILFFSIQTFSFAQKKITLKSYGQGENRQMAIDNSIQNAREQIFGSYISSNTIILNDEIIKDKISAITNGEILSYEIIEGDTLPNQSYYVMLDVTLTENSIINYYNKIGGEKIEFKGDLFIRNIELLNANKEAEINSVKNLLEISETYTGKTIDYIVKESNKPPQSNGNGTFNFYYNVEAKANINIIELSTLLVSGFQKISLTKTERKVLDLYNLEYYKIYMLYNKNGHEVFHFRNPNTIRLINSFRAKYLNSEEDFQLFVNESSNHSFTKKTKNISRRFLQNYGKNTGNWVFNNQLPIESIGNMNISTNKEGGITISNNKKRKSISKLNKIQRLGNSKKSFKWYFGTGYNMMAAWNISHIHDFENTSFEMDLKTNIFNLTAGVRVIEFMDVELGWGSGGIREMWSNYPINLIGDRVDVLKLNTNFILRRSHNVIKPYVGFGLRSCKIRKNDEGNAWSATSSVRKVYKGINIGLNASLRHLDIAPNLFMSINEKSLIDNFTFGLNIKFMPLW